MSSHFETNGWFWIRSALSANEITELRKSMPGDSSRVRINSSFLPNFAKSVLSNASPVRQVFFNKSAQYNWGIGWHQDRVIAVDKKRSISGFDHWSHKAGFWHCEPPEEYLQNMVFTQIYLDDVSMDSGPTVVASKSHRFGKIEAGNILNVVDQCDEIGCTASVGDVLVAKMLLLHKSKKSKQSTQRRILRIDYSNMELPDSLAWAVELNSR